MFWLLSQTDDDENEDLEQEVEPATKQRNRGTRGRRTTEVVSTFLRRTPHIL